MLATMFEYPLAQSILIIILDCLMIAYLFIKRPFESTFDFYQQLFFEFVGLGVMISVFVNAVFDSGKYETIQGRNNVGKLIIVSNILFNFVAVAFMLILIGQSLLEFYKDQKEKRAKRLRPFTLQNRLQNASHLDSSQSVLKTDKFTQDNFVSDTSQNLETISFQQESFDSNFLRNSGRNFRRNRLFNQKHQSPDFPSLTNEESFQINERSFQGLNRNNPQIFSQKNSSNVRPQRRQDGQPFHNLIMPGIRIQPKIQSNLPPSSYPRR